MGSGNTLLLTELKAIETHGKTCYENIDSFAPTICRKSHKFQHLHSPRMFTALIDEAAGFSCYRVIGTNVGPEVLFMHELGA